MLKASIFIFCASLATLAVSVKDVDVGSIFTICKRGDPNFNECLKNSIQSVLPKFAEGIPQLNIPSLEPILIDKVTVGAGSGAVNVVQNYLDVKIHNVMTKMTINEVDAKVEDNKFTAKIKAHTPEFKMLSTYDFNGRILVLPIVGTGACDIRLFNMDLDIVIEIDTFEKGGKKYGKVSKFTTRFLPKDAHFELENLFGGDDRLGKPLLKVINDNWQELFEDVREGYEDLLSNVLTTYVNMVFKNIEYDKLFGA